MMLNYKIPQIISISLALSIVACSGNNGTSNGGAIAPTGATLITIDNTGVVPILNNAPTTSEFYVHNNSNVTISGISYVAINNTGGSNFLNENSASVCGTIPAGQSCPLSFTTPVISSSTAQGSTLVTASYTVPEYNDGKIYTFSQTISYGLVSDNSTKGDVFNSGVLLTSSGNATAYGTLYLFGSGSNQIYTVNSLAANKNSVQITQGNVTGKQTPSNYVQAVEVSAPASLAATQNILQQSSGFKNVAEARFGLTGGFNANLTAISSLQDGTQFISVANLGVAPAASGAILTAGQVPITDTSVANPSGSMYITNSGNAVATLGTITFPMGVSLSSGEGACGATIDAGAACTVYFTLPQASGNGNITVPYSGGVASPLVQTITWYNSINEALLAMSEAANPLSFSATIGGSTTVTVTNIGGYNLTNVASSATIMSGHASESTTVPVCIESGGSPSGTTLYVGGSCTYTVSVSDNVTETGNINLGISGNYNNGSSQTYSRLLALSYISNEYTALLSVVPSAMTIVGNNTESSAQTLVINNNGEAPALITSSSLTTAPDYMNISANACSGQTLNSGESCTVVVVLGPTTAAIQESGTAVYTVSYGGAQAAPGTTATGNIPYTVQANNQNFTMSNISSSDGITGNGTSGTSYTISGLTSNPAITFTYTNGGTNPAQISGISNTNSPIAWVIDKGASTCYNGGVLPSATIAVGASCTIVFNNVLAQYAQAVPGGLGASYTENLIVPTITFQDQTAAGTQFSVTPAAPAPISGTTVYVTGTQATLVNSASYSMGYFTVSHVLANAIGYPALTVTSLMENYFRPPVQNGCSISESSGIQTQTCTLNPSGGGGSPGTATASGIYTVDLSTYPSATLHVLFGLSSTSAVVSFTPLSAAVTYSVGLNNH